MGQTNAGVCSQLAYCNKTKQCLELSRLAAQQLKIYMNWIRAQQLGERVLILETSVTKLKISFMSKEDKFFII